MKNLQKGDRVQILLDYDKYRGRIGRIVEITSGSTKWYLVEIDKTAVKKIYHEEEIRKIQ